MGKICEWMNAGKWQKPLSIGIVVAVVVVIIALIWSLFRFARLSAKITSTIIFVLIGGGLGTAIGFL